MKSAQLSMLAGLAITAAAFAAPQENTGNLGPVNSNGPLNNAANGIANFNSVGGYTLRSVYYSGTLTAVNAGTFASEARILVTPAGGNPTVTLGEFWTTGTFAGGLTMSGSYGTGAGYNPAGAWTFRCYETFDDGGTSSVDAVWDPLNFILDDAPLPPPPPPPATDLGLVDVGTNITNNSNLAANTINWFKITLAQAASVGNNTFCDISSFGSTLAPTNDTEFGIYREDGTLRLTDDDDGPLLLTQASFGRGRRLADQDGSGNEGLNFSGQDGTLDAGVYYIATCSFNATFGASNFTVTTPGANAGNYRLNIRMGGPPCPADFNGDGQVDFFDYLDFVQAFSNGC